MKGAVNPLVTMLLCVVLGAPVLSGCQRSQGNPVEEESPVAVDDSLSGQAIVDLATRLGVSPGEVVLVSEETVTWRDGSLGCPKKDMMYTQALVDGQLIVLKVAETQYRYHSGNGRPPFYCEKPVDPAPTSALD